MMRDNRREPSSPPPSDNNQIESRPPLRQIAKTALVRSASATYTDSHITAQYDYGYVHVTTTTSNNNASAVVPVFTATPAKRRLVFSTARAVPRVGVMLVGLGGNNGTTFLAGVVANKRKLKWRTKQGVKEANWYGSLMLSSTAKLGTDAETGDNVYVPLKSMLPMLDPDDLVVGGWDISAVSLGDAMRRAAVVDVELQDQLYDEMQLVTPLPGVYHPGFIAPNQSERADHCLKGSLVEQLEQIRNDIARFRDSNKLAKVLVLWTATTERFLDLVVSVLVLL